jgi:hypothetical protein
MGHKTEKVIRNPGSMSNSLPSTQEMRHFDHCCGIHGAARARKGAKHGASVSRRCNDKEIIKSLTEEMLEEDRDMAEDCIDEEMVNYHRDLIELDNWIKS